MEILVFALFYFVAELQIPDPDSELKLRDSNSTIKLATHIVT